MRKPNFANVGFVIFSQGTPILPRFDEQLALCKFITSSLETASFMGVVANSF